MDSFLSIVASGNYSQVGTEESQLQELPDGIKKLNLTSELEKASDKEEDNSPSCNNTSSSLSLPTTETCDSLEETSQYGGMCQNCSKSDGTCYCKDCFLILCESCVSQHKKLKPFDKHVVLQMEEYVGIVTKTKDEHCAKHDKPLFLYCMSCNCCVCQECRANPDHMNHSIKLLCDYIMEDVNAEYDTRMKQLQETMDSLKQEQEKVTLEGELAIRNIDLQTQAMIDQLTEYGRQIHEKVDNDTKRKIKTLREQEEDADEMLQELQDCERYVELYLQYSTPEQVLMHKNDLLKYVETVVKKAQQKNYEPLVEADISLTRN